RGYFDRDELWSYRRLGAMLQGYPPALRIPGVDAPGGGSPGMGLGVANGLALALRDDERPPTVFCLAGERDCQEGAFWEAVMASPRFMLSNLVLLLETREPGGLGARMEAFGWRVEECDGHDCSSLSAALAALGADAAGPRSRCVMARTTPGRGVPFLEEDPLAEGDFPDRECVDRALAELDREGGLL
ncbi:MAG: transketolase, partial [Synergistota bacterium]|nr:transketolase [Synergistota bacterium]